MKEESIVSVRLDKELHSQMKLHEEINWSAILRRAIQEKLAGIQSVNLKRARKAVKEISRIRKSGVFSGGKKSEEIIREWRDKRK